MGDTSRRQQCYAGAHALEGHALRRPAASYSLGRMQVEIAPLLTAESAYDGPDVVMNTAGTDVAWEDRAKVVVDVTLEMTLGTIVDRGAELLGLRVNSTPYYNEHDVAAVDLKPSDLPSDIRFHNPSLTPPFGEIRRFWMMMAPVATPATCAQIRSCRAQPGLPSRRHGPAHE